MDQPNQVEYLALTFLLTFTNHSAKTNRLHLQSRVQGATPKVASNVQTAALKCHELDFCYWAFWNRTFDHFILMLPWNEIVPIIASYYQSFTHHFLFFYLPFFLPVLKHLHKVEIPQMQIWWWWRFQLQTHFFNFFPIRGLWKRPVFAKEKPS